MEIKFRIRVIPPNSIRPIFLEQTKADNEVSAVFTERDALEFLYAIRTTHNPGNPLIKDTGRNLEFENGLKVTMEEV